MANTNIPTRVKAYINIIIDNVEGGFVDHPSDPGGATNWGITIHTARSHGYTGDMRNLPREKAVEIYYNHYWKGKFFSKIENHLAFHLLDCHINSGNHVNKIIQHALGLKQDGVIGPATLNAISTTPEGLAITLFNVARMRFYSTLSLYSVYGRGWTNRLLKLSSLDWNKEMRKYGLD